MTFNNLIVNISILITATFLFGQSLKYYLKNKIIQNILLGIIFGTISVLSMVFSFQYSPGLIFDGRSIILGVAGIVGGYVPALISITITLIYRIYLGGSGMNTGIMVILLSGLSGAVLYQFMMDSKKVLNLILVYIYSLCLHVAIIVIFYLSITEEGNVLIVIKSVWKAFVIVYPFITVFIYFIFNEQKRRMNMEVSLIESGEKIKSLSEIVKQTDEGIAQADLNGNITYVNKAWSDMHGYSNPNECLNKNLSIFHNKEQLENEVIPFNEKVNKYGTYKGEVGHITKDGKQFSTLMTTTLLKNTQDKPYAIVGIAQDITEQKQAVEKLKESEKKFKAIFENKGTATGIFGEDSIIRDCNYIFEELSGYNKSEIIGKMKWSDFVVKEDLERLSKYHVQRLKKENSPPTNYECGIINKKGNIVNVIVNISIMGTNRIVSLTDITARKEAVEKLVKSQALYQDLVETAQDLIWQCDKEGRFIFINSAWKDTHGYEIDEMLGKKFTDFQKQEWAEKDTVEFKRLMRGNMVKGLETEHISKDGREINLIFNAKFIKNENGEIIGTRGTAFDITRWKKAEEELHKKEETISAIVNTSHEWIWNINLQGIHTFSNPAIESILGYPVNDIVGKSCFNLMHKHDRQTFETKLPQFISEKQGWKNLVIRWRHRNGSWRYLESSAVPIISTDGEILGFRGVDRDITERKLAEDELQKKLNELKIFNDVTVGRELKMIELKKEINAMLEQSGKKPKYKIPV